MGRIKTTFIKTIGKELFEKHADKFSNDFSTNKKIVNQLIDVRSKKQRNVITGYITSLKKQKGIGY